jgi:hypothetical protein
MWFVNLILLELDQLLQDSQDLRVILAMAEQQLQRYCINQYPFGWIPLVWPTLQNM